LSALISSHDVNKEIVLKIFNAIDNYSESKPVLGFLFLNESTRTSASLKSAIIKMGGGWLGIEGIKGSYLANSMDSINNSIKSLSNYCDIIALRGDIDETTFLKSSVPIINCGSDFVITPIWGIWLSYLIKNIFGDKKLNIGIYGLAGFSSPIKSYYSVLSLFGHSFFEDSIIPDTSSSDEIIKQIIQNKSSFQKSYINDFIDMIDLLVISDCNPEQNISKQVYTKFFDSFRPVDARIFEKLSADAKVFVVEPYKFLDGKKSTIEEEQVSNHRIINDNFNKLSVEANIGIINYLLFN
jgi:aspartate carbamoyltransferase catalytic subunit